MMDKPTRVYTLGDLVVEWRLEKCVHCEACKNNLPAVFDPERRPWVDLSKGEPDEIRRVVAMCPDGALSIGGA